MSPVAEASTLLTPPETPDIGADEDGSCEPRISSIFRLEAALDPSTRPDLSLLSSDRVIFYVHTRLLLYASQNAFGGLLANPVPASDVHSSADRPMLEVPVPDSAPLLSVVLQALYGIDLTAHSTDLTLLSLAVDALLGRYAVRADLVLSPGRPLFEALLAHAAVRPLHVYSLAGHYDLEALAVAASPHMLTFPLCLLSDDDARRMGPVYLRRLFFQHLGRAAALRRLLGAAAAPALHACGLPGQPAVRRAWALAIAALMQDVRPDMSTQTIEATLGPLLGRIGCADCRSGLKASMDGLVAGWAAVKRTI